jgi:RNA polymerase sigma-70 factor (ECF subfamily)
MESEEIGSLYCRLSPTIYRRCVRLLGDGEMAKDATQEVFVRVVRLAGKLHEDRAYLPWLYRVATNLCLDLLRHERRTPWAAGEASEAEATQNPGDDEQTSAVVARQALVRLWDSLDRLSKQIAVYAFVDNMTQTEIGEVTGLSRKTIGKKLKRVREAARTQRDAE